MRASAERPESADAKSARQNGGSPILYCAARQKGTWQYGIVAFCDSYIDYDRADEKLRGCVCAQIRTLSKNGDKYEKVEF